MLKISEKEGERIFEEYWNAVPPLKELRDSLTVSWKKTGKQYITGLDGRKYRVRQEYSILNLLLQSAGALTVKYIYVLTSQKLEMHNQLIDMFEDTEESSKEKACSMIIYHDECQYAIPRSWYKPLWFKSEEEAAQYRKEHKFHSPVHFSEKVGKYYLDNQMPIDMYIEESIDEAGKVVDLNVRLQIESTTGLNWRDCH